MIDFTNLYLLKAENPEAYKKLAEKGIMVAHSVKIGGQDKRPDIGIPYHTTVKFFNPDKDSPDAIHQVARERNFTPPDPKETKIEPTVFKDRVGNDVFVIKLHGKHADEIKEHNSKFSHMGHPPQHEFSPHVSVDKGTWDKIVASKATNAHDAGIEFGPAELRQGHNVLATYRHNPDKKQKHGYEVLAASEKLAGEPMNKGLKQIASAAAFATALGLASQSTDATSSMLNHSSSPYSRDKMLRTIASVESSGGKFVNHRQLNGPIHQGDSAYGKYALTPATIKETIRMNTDLKAKHKKAMGLQGNDLKHYIQDNPGLEDSIADKHLARLEHHFGKDPAKIGYAWLEGIQGGLKASKENKDIGSHWHVKKIKQAYTGEK